VPFSLLETFKSDDELDDFKVPVLFKSFVAFTFFASFDLLTNSFAFLTCKSFFYFWILILASVKSRSKFSKYSILFFLSVISVSLAIDSVMLAAFETFDSVMFAAFETFTHFLTTFGTIYFVFFVMTFFFG